MNTAPKSPEIRECSKCDNTFMVSGGAVIRLSQHRPAHLDPRTGQPLTGVCPDHQKNYSS